MTYEALLELPLEVYEVLADMKEAEGREDDEVDDEAFFRELKSTQ